MCVRAVQLIQMQITITGKTCELPTVEVNIDDNEALTMYIDTCCTINVIDEVSYNRMQPKPLLKKVATVAWSYQSTAPIKFLGEFVAKIRCRSKTVEARVSVVEGKERCLLGFKSSDDLGVVKIINSVDQVRNLAYWQSRFPAVFSGKLGKLKDFEVKLDIDESV